jgi:hypothetical protein
VVPSSFELDPPSWAGNIHSIPPSCNKRKKKCTPGIPVSRKTHSLGETLISVNPFDKDKLSIVDLPNDGMDTMAITIGDFNQDGMFDIVIGNNNTQPNQLLVNGGDGTFRVIKLPGGNKNTESIAIGDVNNDGWIDIVFGNLGHSNQLLINRGHHGISFDHNVTDLNDNGYNTRSIILADVNNDGMLDIIIGNDSDSRHSSETGRSNQLLINDGDGIFQQNPVNLPGGTMDTRSLVAAYIDDDDKIDIVVGNYQQTNQVLINNGDDTRWFKDPVDLPGIISSRTWSIAVADFNEDDSVDIVVGNWNQDNILLINSGNNDVLFDSPIRLPGGDLHSPQSIATADINNDGMVDIVVGNYGQDDEILINNGGGNFVLDPIPLPGNSMNTRSIALADMNKDGTVDIIMGVVTDNNNNYKSTNQILMNVSHGSFQKAVDLPGNDGTDTRAVVMADLNNDGLTDVVVGNYNHTNHLLINSGDGKFHSVVDLPDGTSITQSIVLADLNDDGMTDIVVGNEKQNNMLLINTSNHSDNLFDADRVTSLPGGKTNTRSIALADLDDDGDIDIVIGNYGEYNQLLINTGNGSFIEENIINLPGGLTNTTSIAIADVNNDGLLDIVVGNWEHSNQIIINTGNRTFQNATDLPGGAKKTSCIVIADIYSSYTNSDSSHRGVDIIVGNWKQNNYLLINNGSGSFEEFLDLPGSAKNTRSIAAADINGDGLTDIVSGNNNGHYNQLLLNSGNAKFENAIDLPGGTVDTESIAVADIDNDGMMDIVVGKHHQHNQLLPFSSCPNGGARLHSKSWCFLCPSFMGRNIPPFNIEKSMCMECMPDHLQKHGTIDICAIDDNEKCPLGERNFTQDKCSKRCPDGTYYNNTLTRLINDTSTWDAPRCVPCLEGTYAKKVATIDKCLKCEPGTYQPNKGADECLTCPVGEFQPDPGQTKCKKCPKGGYCNATRGRDGGFIPCTPGTYNDMTGQSDASACRECPKGSYSAMPNTTTCFECQPGTYSDETGKYHQKITKLVLIILFLNCYPHNIFLYCILGQAGQCKKCQKGEFQLHFNSTTCDSCPSGTYVDKDGFEYDCIQCPYRVSSGPGSDTCPFCEEGFYLNNMTVDATSIFRSPDKYCFPCPLNAICPGNTTLSNLGIQEGYFRYSNKTSKIYNCESIKNNTACIGASDEMGHKTEIQRRRQIQENSGSDSLTTTGMYCQENHTGPLCEVCVNDGEYFDPKDGECTECPSFSGILQLIFISIICVAIMAFVICYGMTQIPTVSEFLSNLSLQAKFKILVSFYQLLSTLEDVHGVVLSDELTNWIEILEYLSLDFLNIFEIPVNCIGSTQEQLIFGAIWPYINILLGAVCFYVGHAITKAFKNYRNGEEETWTLFHGDILDRLRLWTIEWALILFYFALPSISQHIFSAVKCRAFQIDDNDPPTFVSHLRMNMSIICDSTKSEQYGSIKTIFWFFFVIWIVLTPLGFLILLKYISTSIQSKSITFLADACRFLWQDYDTSMWYWDVVDTWRKIFLTGLIMLIDPEEGSNKIFRLVIAIIILALYLCLFLAYRPYKREDNYNLGLVSNFLLLSCFCLSIILKLCDSEDDAEGTCSRYIGYSLNSYNASVVVLVLALFMLILTACFVAILTINKIREPTVQMKSSGNAPNLELPEDCTSHVFVSYLKTTGHSQTHVIVQKMQLLLPGFKVYWLGDVDEFEDVPRIEESVADSAIFILFYSKHYFRSTNCQRELYAAIKLNKPIILLYEGEQSILEEMQQECINNCDNNDGSLFGSEAIIRKLLGEDDHHFTPTQWLNEASFSSAALNRIYCRVLGCLPYYKTNPHKLEEGIIVPGELGPVSLQYPINLFVYGNNHGCRDLADELKASTQKNSELISISNAVELVRMSNDEEEDIYQEEDIEQEEIGILEQEEEMVSDNYSFRPPPPNNPVTQEESIPLTQDEETIPALAKKSIFLLYLNEYTFDGGDGHEEIELPMIIQSCVDDPNMTVVLIQEKEILKGGCTFDTIFTKAPQKLVNPPYNLFKDTVIPIYSMTEYRNVSLRKIYCKMGATPIQMNRMKRWMRMLKS